MGPAISMASLSACGWQLPTADRSGQVVARPCRSEVLECPGSTHACERCKVERCQSHAMLDVNVAMLERSPVHAIDEVRFEVISELAHRVAEDRLHVRTLVPAIHGCSNEIAQFREELLGFPPARACNLPIPKRWLELVAPSIHARVVTSEQPHVSVMQAPELALLSAGNRACLPLLSCLVALAELLGSPAPSCLPSRQLPGRALLGIVEGMLARLADVLEPAASVPRKLTRRKHSAASFARARR